MRLRGLVVLAAAAAFVLAPTGAPSVAENPRLLGTVGPGFTIRLTHPDGTAVTQVDPGVYDIVVRDLDGEHNFHLSGVGVNEFTDVEALVNVTWTVTLQEARYTFVCDPHATTMRGQFAAGNPPAPPPPPPAPAPAVKRLTLTVGPAATIVLTNAAGKRITATKAGAYTITVRDRSKLHNAHLVGKGVNRKSGLAATGTLTWKLKLAAGPLRFFSDRSPKTVKGSIRVT
jgi:plastocyanin